MLQEIKTLVQTLNEQRDAYYNKDSPKMTDKEYDRLFDRLDTTGFDHEQSTLSVNGADISPGESHQTIPGQIHICFIYFLF